MVKERNNLMKELTENAKITLSQRYLLKNEKGEVIETIPEMFKRIANAVAEAEMNYDQGYYIDGKDKTDVYYNTRDTFLDIMENLDFLPNSPTIMNAGKEDGQLSACFVLPIEDSMESIFETLKRTALIHKSGGGTGFSFSRIREKDAVVKTTGGIASGPISFMKIYNAATEEVKQGGCFIAGTLIQTSNGPKPIENLHEGDLVYSYNKDTNTWYYTPCTDPFKTKTSAEVKTVVLESGDRITATPDHPFMIYKDENKEFVKLEELKKGDVLVSYSGDVRVKEIKDHNPEDVWNVEVPSVHNYCVYIPNLSDGVVVSNSRRGASMSMLRVDHPDILDFIDCKTVDGVLNNFNISVALTDSFMEAVKEDKEYDLISPKDGKVVKTLRAKEVFEKLVNNAWNNGEPGIFFIDRANQYNPTPNEGEYESTNPCGEQILLPNESCNLGSINLANMVIEKSFNTMIQWKDIFKYDKIIDINNLEAALVGVIDFDKLQYVVETAVRFLDDVIDVNCFPFKEIEEQTKRNRKIGLGIMGFAEMLVKIGVPYNSELGRKVAEVVMKFISNTAINASIKLARVRGTFPTYEDSTWKLMDAKMRNATVTTLAPTGTISLIAGTSSGIEPYFSFAYERHILDGKTLLERNELLANVLKEYGIYSDELIKKIVNNHGMLKGITEIPEEIRSVFVSAHEISPKDHILIQAAFQKYVDNAISKTINFTNDATKEDIYNAFMLAYDSGCKGTTVYRDGSRSTQVLVTSSTEKKDEENDSNIDVYNRPKKLYGSTKTIKIGCGKILVTVNHDNNNKVKEVIIISGKGGGCHAQSEAIGRLISISLRANVDINEIIHQLRGIRCDACKKKGLDGISCPDAIGRFIEEEQKLLDHEVITIHPTIEEIEESVVEEPVNASNKCPQCGAQLAHESGCVKCYNCDYSKCD